MLLDAPAGQLLPTEQAWHVAAEVWPTALEKVPAGHSVQEGLPAEGA